MLDERTERLTGEEPGFLTEEELLRLAAFRFEKRRSEWLLGRWTAKQLLRRSQPAYAQGVGVRNEAGGKPYFVDQNGAALPGCLSISHRGGRAFCAWSGSAEAGLGADLEVCEPRDKIFVEDYLSPPEQTLALACEGQRRDLVVTLMWSAKEAVFKALGTGLRMDTRSVTVGGLEGLTLKDEIPNGWLPLTFESKVVLQPMRGFWRLEGNFLLTVAVLGEEQIELIEV
jgi:4'-phosphopantetheinyl transferase